MTTPGLRSRLLRVFGFSVISQGLLSLTSLAVGILLLRYASSEDYGYYVLAQSLILLPVLFVSAWINGPLAVLAPQRTEAEAQSMVVTLAADLRRGVLWLIPVGLLACLAVWWGRWIGDRALWVALAIVLAMAGAVYREFLRGVLMLRARSGWLLVADSTYAAILAAAALLACFGLWPAAPVAVLGVAVGGVLAAAVSSWTVSGRGAVAPPVPMAGPGPWRAIRPLAVWSALGAGLHWAFAQGFNSVLAVQAGIEAVAEVNAVRLFVMPVFLMITGVQGVLVPMASRFLKEQGLSPLLRRLMVVLVLLWILGAGYLGLIWLLRDWVAADVLRKALPALDPMLMLWATMALTYTASDLLQTALLALGRFRQLAGLSAICAAAALATMPLAVAQWGAIGALWSLLLGEIIKLAGMLLLIALARRSGGTFSTG